MGIWGGMHIPEPEPDKHEHMHISFYRPKPKPITCILDELDSMGVETARERALRRKYSRNVGPTTSRTYDHRGRRKR